jgi:flagellar motor switch protein FliN
MADDPTAIGPDEIERLLGQAASGPPPSGQADPAPAKPAQAASADSRLATGDVEFLLSQAQAALASVDAPRTAEPHPPATTFSLPELSGAAPSSEFATLELIRDVELDLRIELGRTHMPLEDVLRLRRGAVVPLDKLAGDPVDIYVNGRLIARGEVLVMNDNFCVRVAELIAAEPARAG